MPFCSTCVAVVIAALLSGMRLSAIRSRLKFGEASTLTLGTMHGGVPVIRVVHVRTLL